MSMYGLLEDEYFDDVDVGDDGDDYINIEDRDDDLDDDFDEDAMTDMDDLDPDYDPDDPYNDFEG